MSRRDGVPVRTGRRELVKATVGGTIVVLRDGCPDTDTVDDGAVQSWPFLDLP